MTTVSSRATAGERAEIGALRAVAPEHSSESGVHPKPAWFGSRSPSCGSSAATVAAAFIAGRPPTAGSVLGTVDVHGKGTLTIKPVTCPVVAVARPIGATPVTFSWLRRPSTIARSTGGRWIQCP